MASKITFFLLLALVIACATMVRVPTAEAQVECKRVSDCKINLLCKVGETKQCVHNQCICAPKPEIRGESCLTTRDCDVTMCLGHGYMKCVDGFCTCTR
ncbi:hypothetical protein Bca4012_060059 [Brassica carinata]